jgi:hypothetical protein
MAAKHGLLPHLQPGEVTLLNYAADDSRDVVTLSDKEALVLQLYNQIQEQQLEKAVLEQGMTDSSPFNFLPFFFLIYFPIRIGNTLWRKCRRAARDRRT